MTRGRLVRLFFSAIGVIVGVLVLISLGIIAKGEWNARGAHTHRIPAFAAVSPAGGTDTAPVLILLHGAGLNGRMWDAVRRHLDPAFRIIALDLPGHGARSDEVFSLDAAVATVAAAARSVAPASVVLVGDSLGGYTAMASAGALPREQLRGIVIGGCTASLGRAAMLRYLRDVVVIDVMSAFIDQPKLAARALSKLGVTDLDAQAIIAAGVDIRAVPADVRALLNVDFRAALAAIDRPVLIVNGTLDANSMSEEAAFLGAARHGAGYHFDNTEHGVSLRRPAEFAGLVNDFVARVMPSPDAPPP